MRVSLYTGGSSAVYHINSIIENFKRRIGITKKSHETFSQVPSGIAYYYYY